MSDKPDPKSLRKLKAAAAMIPPQTSPRAAKSLADLKRAIRRMEREAKDESNESSL